MRRPFLFLVAFSAPLLVANNCLAAPVSLRFQTTIDASFFGRSDAEPFVATFTYDSALANGTGPTAISPTISSYGPLTMVLAIGEDVATATGGGVTLNDLPPGAGVDVLHVMADSNGYGSSQDDWSGEILGYDVGGFILQVFDNQSIMFDGLDLPTSASFVAEADSAALSLYLHDGGALFFEVTNFALRSVPEPSTSLLLGAAALPGISFGRRRIAA
jgi:hypothetical protein